MYRIKSPQLGKQRRTLTMEVVDALKDAISMGKLRPNEKLVESQLTSELGISRTPFREALNRLEVEGYVKRLPLGGYIVVDHNVQQIRELYEVRQALEGYAAQLACHRATKKQIQDLERVSEKMSKAYERKDIESIRKLNDQFHAKLSSTCSNEQLTAQIQALRGYFFSRRVSWFLSLSDWRKSIDEHQQLVNAIKKQDYTNISEVVHNHLGRALKIYTKHLM